MVPTPLAVEVRPGAVEALGPLLADRRISSGGHVAVVVGPGLGEEIAAKLAGQLPDAVVKHVDGVAVTFAQTAALAVLHRDDGIDDEDFLMTLADALVLSGLAMATAGSSRPCSGSDHEIVHAIDHLHPQLGRNHGELAGAAAL